jgi:hypothetical protein
VRREPVERPEGDARPRPEPVGGAWDEAELRPEPGEGPPGDASTSPMRQGPAGSTRMGELQLSAEPVDESVGEREPDRNQVR